ncbi:MAG: KPN_02809 family neutral zinc metallopeptidase [bacterium]
MKWKNRRVSGNIEDRRGIKKVGKRGGLVSIVIILAAMYFGVDPQVLFTVADTVQGTGGGSTSQYKPSAAEDRLAQFTSVVLADTEDVWNAKFKKLGGTYQEPKLVMFTGSVQSGCGNASAAMGPFYCPADKKVYIDLGFYKQLKSRHNAPGDFAQAYVIAHEVGHHVQNLLGLSSKVHKAQQGMSKTDGNKLSVLLELQADCLAGIWAHDTQKAKQVLEQGDIEEALNAASAIGDDRLQREATGRVQPESFTHGTSEQRVKWFKQGFQTGSIDQCNTFGSS